MGKRAAEWLCCFMLCFCIVMNVDIAVRIQYPAVSYILGNGTGRWKTEEMAERMMSFQFPLLSYMKEMRRQTDRQEAWAYDRIRTVREDYGYEAEDYEEITGGCQTEEAYQSYTASDSSQGEETAQETEPVSQAEPESAQKPKAQEAFGRPFTYSVEQFSDFQFLLSSLYFVHPSTGVNPELLNVSAMTSYDARLTTPADQPQILIYHTHASEYFADSDIKNPDTLITGVGERLAGLLRERYGLNVIHDTTLFPYQQAYSQGLDHLKKLLEQYPSVEVVIDLHRDAAEGQHLMTEVNGKKTARIMFFNGISRSTDGPIDYLENPYLSENLAFSFQLKLMADALYPGLARKNYLKSYRYNLHMRPKSVLVEAGAETNTLEEELNAMEPLAEILAKVLKGESP